MSPPMYGLQPFLSRADSQVTTQPGVNTTIGGTVELFLTPCNAACAGEPNVTVTYGPSPECISLASSEYTIYSMRVKVNHIAARFKAYAGINCTMPVDESVNPPNSTCLAGSDALSGFKSFATRKTNADVNALSQSVLTLC